MITVGSSYIDDLRTQAREKFLSWADHEPKRWQRGVEYNPILDNVVAVLNYNTDEARWVFGRNLVTNDGDIYYAKKGAGETPSTNENFLQARCELANPSSQSTPAKADTYDEMLTPITASRKTISGTYPKTNDTGDADNTGDAVDAVSYSYSWTTSDFNDGGTTIKNGCLHDNASPVGSTKVLTHFTITAFNKTSSDTLKLFVNHTMNGV